MAPYKHIYSMSYLQLNRGIGYIEIAKSRHNEVSQLFTICTNVNTEINDNKCVQVVLSS